MPAQVYRALGRDKPARVNKLAKKLAARHKRQHTGPGRPLTRKTRKSKPRVMIAYDLETTPIKAGTPEPLYLTAYGEDFRVSHALKGLQHLAEILIARFLTPENHNVRFVAWNGNNYDCFFIGAALLHSKDYIIRPYLTRSKALRGVRVTLKTKKGEPKQSWEFLDGISMISGGNPMTLEKFLKTFAPDHLKLKSPDWEKETFNPSNPEHVAYAERDSEGLYHGLMRAQSIVQEHFGQGLQPTIGNLGIRIFQAHMPESKAAWAPPYELDRIIRSYLMRGGFCFAARHYAGPVWKYDLNQAYCAAMRDADLPCGRAVATTQLHPYAKCAIYRVTARSTKNRVPFYVRGSDGKSIFALSEILDSWITSSELQQLSAEGWKIKIHAGYFWEDAFRMHDLVGKLESLRMADPDGPSGAQGSMMKAIGNNCYGKTVEELDGLELVMSHERPDESFFMYQNESDVIQHIWAKFGRPHFREYHQPQIGAFITAHVRMLVRRAILQNPDAWLYSDTDCCFFDRAVNTLPIDPKKYGYWKIEETGAEYRIITKKVYAKFVFDESGKEGRHAKGMNVRRLKMRDFEDWFNGTPPEQTQTHLQNFLAVMTGAEMFVERVKFGADYRKRMERIARE